MSLPNDSTFLILHVSFDGTKLDQILQTFFVICIFFNLTFYCGLSFDIGITRSELRGRDHRSFRDSWSSGIYYIKGSTSQFVSQAFWHHFKTSYVFWWITIFETNVTSLLFPKKYLFSYSIWLWTFVNMSIKTFKKISEQKLFLIKNTVSFEQSMHFLCHLRFRQ